NWCGISAMSRHERPCRSWPLGYSRVLENNGDDMCCNAYLFRCSLKPKIDLEATDKAGKGFHVIPWRWAVERTFAWLLNDRRHSRDYERLTVNSAAMIQISMIRLLLKRLA